MSNKEIRVQKVISVPKSIDKIHDIFKKDGFKLYLVGGAVRDTLVNKYPKDFDLVTDATPEKIKSLLHMYPTIESGEQFGVVNVVTEDDTYEIATFRFDIGRGRRPNSVEFTTIDKDVLRRDLTINALFYDLDTKEIVDLVGGISDLENGIVRTVGNAVDRFDEDKLRILRALRFAGRIGSDVDDGIDKAIKRDNTIISGDGKPLAQERIQDEFIKGIKQAKSVKHFVGMIEKYGLFQWIFHDMDVSGEILNIKNPIILVSSILRNETVDIDKRLTGILKFTKLQGKQIKFLIDFFKNGTPNTAYKFKEKVKTLSIDGSIIHHFGKQMGMNKQFIKCFNKYEISIDGDTLFKQGFNGRDLGIEKERLETEIFNGLLRKSTINYSALLLDNSSHNDLLGVIKEHCPQVTKEWVVVADHMTINLGPLLGEQRHLIGDVFPMTVTHVGGDNNVVAVLIHTTSFDVNTPHVTLSVGPNGKPEMSKQINNWLPIKPFEIKGMVQEIDIP